MGGETKNIDEIAGIISSRIFDELRWKSSKTNDISWNCCMRSHLTEAQLKAKKPTQKKHPTDVVFSYQDPYTDIVQYIQTDLKSYSKTTLEKYGAILKTIRSLSQQVECASRSTEWEEMFLDDKKQPFVIHGMLFIYNHDNEFDRELYQKIAGAATSEYSLPEDSMIVIFDPKLIRFLLDVTENIEKRRAYTEKLTQQENILWQKIPEYDECSFFYPDKHNKIATKGKSLPATIEMITSGLLFYSYEHNFVRDDDGQRLKHRILNIFWQEDVDSESHFIFILEYIFNYQLLNQFDRIFIITPFSSTSGNYLDTAIKTYAAMYSFTVSQLDTLKEKVKSIPFVNQKLSIFEYQVASKQVDRGLCHFS